MNERADVWDCRVAFALKIQKFLSFILVFRVCYWQQSDPSPGPTFGQRGAADDDSKSPNIGQQVHRYLKDLFLKDFFRKFSIWIVFGSGIVPLMSLVSQPPLDLLRQMQSRNSWWSGIWSRKSNVWCLIPQPVTLVAFRGRQLDSKICWKSQFSN